MSLSFDPEALRVLAELINKTGLSEIELVEGDRRLRLAREITQVHTVAAAPAMAATPISVSLPVSADTPKADPARHPGVVKSPMVGVAYLAAEPGAAPYVTIGQSVDAGATLLLIEAMKTFNQIKAPKSGIVTQILVQPGAPVEFDEPLLIIE
ncbi:MAG: acetyl-CoA carboxylase biotin carboxyl carrier protein subunit [Acidocella sp.]|nr:acetyl-CoA carboxylase biotin carboxyl carrier protein subunit [Acidocella sp.]